VLTDGRLRPITLGNLTLDFAEGNLYIRRAIKIESGAKSALDSHAPVIVKPYIANDLPNFDLAVGNVTTVDPSRTFWDKVVILHGLRRWWDRRGELRGRRAARLAPLLRCLPALGFGDTPEGNGRCRDGRGLCAPCTDVLQPARS
jgi:hypothetical protein